MSSPDDLAITIARLSTTILRAIKPANGIGRYFEVISLLRMAAGGATIGDDVLGATGNRPSGTTWFIDKMEQGLTKKKSRFSTSGCRARVQMQGIKDSALVGCH